MPPLDDVPASPPPAPRTPNQRLAAASRALARIQAAEALLAQAAHDLLEVELGREHDVSAAMRTARIHAQILARKAGIVANWLVQ